MVKKRVLFWLYFIYILVLISYLYYLLYINFLGIMPWHNSFIDIIYVLLYVLAIIPLTAYLSERFTDYSFSMGLRENKHFSIFMVVMVSLPIILFSLYLKSEFKEKNLDHIISYNTNDFDYLTINHDDLKTDRKEDAEALNKLFGKYKVKKMKKSEWDGDVSKETGFDLTVYSKDKVEIMASIYENRILLLGSGKAYEVTNGPINMDLVKEIFE